MTENRIPEIPLLDGNSIPQAGYGTFLVDPADTERLVLEALEAGIRHIDTARIYGNEEGVGRAIKASGLPREEIFVTTKLWNDDQGEGKAADTLDASLERLGLDYVDLYLIHWPVPTVDKYVETWAQFPALRESGRTRSIGVCNMLEEHLDRIITETGERPVVNQIELHPYFSRAELRSYCAERDIRVEAWGPLAMGKGGLLDEPVLAEIGAEYGKTPAQVVLRWHIQNGNIVFPKSSTAARMRENIDLFDFELHGDQMRLINALDRGDEGRFGPDTREFGAPKE